MRFFGGFVNFTGVNSGFLSATHNCKLNPGVKNSDPSSLPRHSKLQTKHCFQSRISRWQNTNFDFSGAQLDFLAIFSNKP